MSDDFKVQWSVKAGADMLNIRGNSVSEVEDLFDDVLREQFIDKATDVATLLRAAGTVTSSGAAASSQGNQSQQSSGYASAHVCPHGERVRREGNGRTGHWVGYFCPLEKGNPNQCKPEFEDNN